MCLCYQSYWIFKEYFSPKKYYINRFHANAHIVNELQCFSLSFVFNVLGLTQSSILCDIYRYVLMYNVYPVHNIISKLYLILPVV